MRKKAQKINDGNLIHYYLQYSKRIAIFGIAQWAVVAILAVSIVWIMGWLEIYLADTLAALANNIVTSSSALAIATSGGYYAHSAYDKKLQKRVELALGEDDDEDKENDEEAEDEEVESNG